VFLRLRNPALIMFIKQLTFTRAAPQRPLPDRRPARSPATAHHSRKMWPTAAASAPALHARNSCVTV